MHEKSFEHALNKLYHIIINKWPFFIPLPHESQLPVEFFIIKVWSSIFCEFGPHHTRKLSNECFLTFNLFGKCLRIDSYQLLYSQFFQIQLPSQLKILLVSPESVVIPVKQQVWIASDLTLQKNFCIQDQLLWFGALQFYSGYFIYPCK